MKPLSGYRVLDLTRILAGPFCTMILADLGAEVIKIERPGSGDDSRQYGPFIGEESAYFMSINRNKKSLTLNLKSDEGKDILFKLIEKSDVVVENFSPGTMGRLGFSYQEMKRVNPEIIFASSSGFGQDGPYKNRGAYDAIIQAMGGIMSITGEKDGKPLRVGSSIADIITGIYTAIGIISALLNRERTGKGDRIDISMLDCMVSILENAVARYYATGENPAPLGNRHPSITPYDTYKTRNSYISIGVGNNKLWKKFGQIIGLGEYVDDERFNTNERRTQNVEELTELIQGKMLKEKTAYWEDKFLQAGIPCGPINTIDKVVQSPQLKYRGTFESIDHEDAGEIHLINSPIVMESLDRGVYLSPPKLGENNEEILRNLLKLSQEEISSLVEKNVL